MATPEEQGKTKTTLATPIEPIVPAAAISENQNTPLKREKPTTEHSTDHLKEPDNQFTHATGNLSRIFTAQVNPFLFGGISTAATFMRMYLEQEKKQSERNRAIAIISSIPPSVKEDIDGLFNKYDQALKDAENTEPAEREKVLTAFVKDGIEQIHHNPDLAGHTEKEREQIFIDESRQRFEDRGEHNNLNDFNAIIAKQNLGTEHDMTLSAGVFVSNNTDADNLDFKSITAFEELCADPDVQLALQKEAANLQDGETLSLEQQQIIAYKAHLPKQLKDSADILAELQEAKIEIDRRINNLPPHVADNVMERYLNKQDEIEQALEDQSQKVEYENALANFIERTEKQLQETGARIEDMSMQEVMTKIMTEDPTVIKAFREWSGERGFEETIAEVGKQAGLSSEQLQEINTEIENMNKAGKALAQLKETVVEYGGRHNFLEKTMGFDSEGIFGAAWDALWNTGDYVEKQGKPLEDNDGNLVHHNERGLYKVTVDDFGRTHREYYTDPNVVAELRAKAWDPENPVFYANETPFSEDPKNGKEETLRRNLSEQEILNQISRDQGKYETLDQGEENSPDNIKPAFANASALPEGASSMLQNTWENAVKQNAISIIDMFVTREEPDTANQEATQEQAQTIEHNNGGTMPIAP